MHKRNKHTPILSKNDLFLCIEGMTAGTIAGLVSAFYRYSLTYAEKGLFYILKLIKGNALYIGIWFLLLAVLGVVAAKLIEWESFAGGSGVPQVMAEARGKMDAPWHRTLIAKFISGTLCFFSGLSLGRTGPSVQLGAMAAKGYSKLRHYKKGKRETENLLLSCGAAAGIAATFNAPFAGFFFMLEEIQGKLNRNLMIGGLSACAAASIISQCFFGSGPVFHYELQSVPFTCYWLFIPTGIILGLGGVLYNFCLLKFGVLLKKLDHLPKELIFAVIFCISGIVGLLLPEILAGGNAMAAILEKNQPTLEVILFLLIAKFIFTIFSAGSGVPGGLFFPLLVLGSFLGAACGQITVSLFSLPEAWVTQFILVGIAGLFAAAIRTPLTSIFFAIELCHPSGSFVPIAITVIIACVTANVSGSKPICRTLMNNLLRKNGLLAEEEEH